MREAFRSHRFNTQRAKMLEYCNMIIAEYMQSNLRLTLRQLYYQLVSRSVIPNSDKEYKKLSSLLSNGRLAGLVDWDAIEDRVRQPYKSSEFENIHELMEAAAYSYRLPRWAGQDHYCELWVEKDALAGVLRPIAQRYHITLMVNRGYSSQSAMYESANRINKSMDDYGSQSASVLYLGDLDPSGEDMVRDIQDRLDMFEADVHVGKIALTMEQVNEYNPPPSPTKRRDPRSADFLRKYGESSWEVDALPPDVLTRIIESELDTLVDREKMDQIILKEKSDLATLKAKLEEMD